MDRPLKMIVWNANGVRTRKSELMQFATDHDADVILLCETHLTPDLAFTLPAYTTYRTDRPLGRQRRPAGGTAILVHRRLTHKLRLLQTAPLETTAIYVQLDGIEVTLIAAYASPTARESVTKLSELLATPGPILLGGDLNAKHPEWNSRNPNQRGRQLKRLAERLNDVSIIAPDTPTHYNNTARHTPDVLDIVIMRDIPFEVGVTAVDDLSSDHLPLLVTINTTPTSRSPTHHSAVRVDWTAYTDYLLPRISPLPDPATPRELDEQVATLHKTLGEAMVACTTPAPPRNSRNKLPAHIAEELHTKRRLRRVWQRTREPAAGRRFQAQCERVKSLLDSQRTDSWNAYLDTLDLEDGTAWQLAKKLRRQKAACHPILGRGGLVYSAAMKTEVFAEELEQQFEPHQDLGDAHEGIIEDFNEVYFDGEPRQTAPVTPFTEEEVLAEVLRTKKRKAAGLDRIGARALQSSPPFLTQALARIFNAALKLRHFPSAWKEAKIILIPKPGKDHFLPQNFRPISLLPTISKIFERLLLSRMAHHLEDYIRPEQFGFRAGHSTTLQLIRVINKLVDARNMNLASAAVFLDVSKAFDKVWHQGLLYKLAATPIPPTIVHLLKSYLTERTFRTDVDGCLSTRRRITAGVPQGSVLGPVLYLVYTNDMPIEPRITLSLYADDAMLHCSSASPELAATRMQLQLETLNPWFKRWKIKVNAGKSNAVMFKKFRNMPRAPLPPLILDGAPIAWQPTAKYLGVILDDRLTFSKHADAKIQEARRIQGFLRPMLCRRSPLPLAAKVRIFLMTVRAGVTYASPAWWALLCKTTKKRMESCQSKGLRIITGDPWFVANDVIRSSLKVPTVEEYITTTAAKLFHKAESSSKAHIAELARREGAPEFKLPRPRAILDDPP